MMYVLWVCWRLIGKLLIHLLNLIHFLEFYIHFIFKLFNFLYYPDKYIFLGFIIQFFLIFLKPHQIILRNILDTLSFYFNNANLYFKFFNSYFNFYTFLLRISIFIFIGLKISNFHTIFL